MKPTLSLQATERNVPIPPISHYLGDKGKIDPKEAYYKRKEHFQEKFDVRTISHYIPALHVPCQLGSSKVILYFHANAEDVILAHELLDFIKAYLRVNIIAVEYPGYGIYNEQQQQRRSSFTNPSFVPSGVNPKREPSIPSDGEMPEVLQEAETPFIG